MNSFSGHISEIEVNGSLSLVTVALNEEVKLKSIVIETPDTAGYLALDSPINVLFKETEVILGIGDQLDVSLENKIKGTIKSLEKGTLLGKVVVQTSIGAVTAIVSAGSMEQLALKSGMKVSVMIKSNEIMLAE
ncbi:MAG: molybdopterin-binding protein [Flavobacteriaceae bacterium]